MRRVSTTVVALVGDRAEEMVTALADASNVATLSAEADTLDPLDRAVETWSRVASVHARFTLHAADPLAEVGLSWTRLFNGEGHRGELEIAVSEASARWRAGTIGLPDFYLVLDAEELERTRTHWYLGVLRAAAPSRVIPTRSTDEGVRRAIAGFAAGRWWPDLPELLGGLDHVTPDRVGIDEPGRTVPGLETPPPGPRSEIVS